MKSRLFHGLSDVVNNRNGTYRPVGVVESQEKMPVRAFRSGVIAICCYSLDGIFGDRQGNRVFALSFRNGELPFLERDVIERDPADLNGSKP